MYMRLKRMATGRMILFFFVVFILFNLVVMRGIANQITHYSGGVGPIDLEITGYTPEEAFAMIEAYGKEGRAFYIWTELVADTAYPIVYGGFLMLLTLALTPRIYTEGSFWQKLYLIPIAGVLMDLSENVGIVLMLNSYPEQPVLIARAACAFTLLKWGILGVSLVIAFVLGVTWFVRRNKLKSYN